jgi:hypothetical protein
MYFMYALLHAWLLPVESGLRWDGRVIIVMVKRGMGIIW